MRWLLVLLLLALGAGALLWLLPGTAAPGLLLLERASAGLHARRVQAAGFEIAYLDGGRGELVVLLHGFGGDRYHWPRMVRRMRGDYRFVAPDLPGYGDSSHVPDASYDARAQAGRLHEFTRTLELERFHIAGSSMGGLIAAIYASEHPQRVLSLALIDAAGLAPLDSTDYGKALALGDNPLIPRTRAEYDALLALVFEHPPWIPAPMHEYFARRALRDQAWLTKLFGDLSAGDFTLDSELAQIRAPVLVIWGAEDRVLPASSVDALAARLPDVTVEVLPATGHLPMLERPRETARAYEAFLQQVAAATGGVTDAP